MGAHRRGAFDRYQALEAKPPVNNMEQAQNFCLDLVIILKSSTLASDHMAPQLA